MREGVGEQDVLVKLLDSSAAVLIDFDGPVCDLFHETSTKPAAVQIKDNARRVWGALSPEVEACDDSHGILLRLRDMLDPDQYGMSLDPTPLKYAEDVVRELELRAVREEIARPADGFEELVAALQSLGKRLTIVSNNAEEAVQEYLGTVGLDAEFKGMIFGRDPDEPRRMKPDPDCILRALAGLALTDSPASCLMVGDQPTDLEAARAAQVRFLGYGSAHAALMMAAGADWAVTSHQPTLKAARALLTSNGAN